MKLMTADPTTALMLTTLDIDQTGQVHPALEARRRRHQRQLRWMRLRKKLA